MVDAVLAGDRLDAVATLAADAAGGTGAIVLPAVGAAVAGPGEQRLAAVRRHVSAQLAGQPSPVPPGYVAEAPVQSGADQVGTIVLLDGGRSSPAPGGSAPTSRPAPSPCAHMPTPSTCSAQRPRSASSHPARSS